MSAENEDHDDNRADEFVEDKRHFNFIMVPNHVITLPGITNASFRLYCHYAQVAGHAGQKGSCWQSLNTVSEKIGMCKDTIIKARENLEELGLIEVTRTKNKNGSDKICTSLKDIWPENNGHSGGKKSRIAPRSGSRKSRIGMVEKVDSNKNPLNKNPPNGGADGTQISFLPDDEKEFNANSWSKENENRLEEVFQRLGIPSEKKRRVDSLRRLVGRDKLQPDRVLRAIVWYLENHDAQFTPQVFYPADFADKFYKIEAAMKRVGDDDDGEQKPIGVTEEGEPYYGILDADGKRTSQKSIYPDEFADSTGDQGEGDDWDDWEGDNHNTPDIEDW